MLSLIELVHVLLRPGAQMDDELFQAYKEMLRDVTRFCADASGNKLRSYQQEVAEAIV